MNDRQVAELKNLILAARIPLAEAGTTIDRYGRKKADREKAIRLMNDVGVKLRTLEIRIDEIATEARA